MYRSSSLPLFPHFLFFFFFNDTATTEIYTLSLHDALPISISAPIASDSPPPHLLILRLAGRSRSEEHTSELQSHVNLVCRLLLEKKKKKKSAARLCEQKRIRQA